MTTPKRLAKESDYFWAAIMFYTRIPVPANALHSQEILDKSRKYFPLIGLIIGAITAGAFLAANSIFSVALSVALSMVVCVLSTGAFHEDGFADSCDGFGGGWNHDQVLTIMKDSRVGSYATIGLTLLFGLKFIALFDIASAYSSANHALFFAVIIIAAHTLSRTLSSSMIGVFEYVQDIDKSKVKPITESRLSATDKSIGLGITALPLLVLLTITPAAVLLACLLSIGVAFGFMAYSRHRIGGYTGDVLGAIQQLSELAFYLCFAAAI